MRAKIFLKEKIIPPKSDLPEKPSAKGPKVLFISLRTRHLRW
jgi:hypothetical protein